MSGPTIRAKGLWKRYDGEEPWVLRDISFSIEPGEITILSGPSGSGKTTLLSMLGCLLRPCLGELRVLGHTVQNIGEGLRGTLRRAEIGFVFQSYNLIGALTAEQNIRLALRLRGVADRDPLQLLNAVGMTAQAQSYAEQLSGGQRQRVAIARALAGDPPLLLADEPTAALDAEHGRRVMDLLRMRTRVHGTSVIVVTHDPRVIAFADRVIELEDGAVRRNSRRVSRFA